MTQAARKEFGQEDAVSAHPAASHGNVIWPFATDGVPEGVTSDTVRVICDLRRRRQDFFGAKLFGDPTWEILLRLYAAYLDGNRMSISRLTRTSRVALTTVLRRLGTLEKEGLVTRSEDPFDGRRVFVALSLSGAEAMHRSFAECGNRALVF